MADLADGESTQVKGSAATPYVLKNTGGVYSCTCPAWRNQSIAIETRTCKHLRKLRGEEAESARVGHASPPSRPRPATVPGDDNAEAEASGPPLLLAHSWDGVADLTGWWLSEKLDGVRAYWDGRAFVSRLGNTYHAPEWFTAGLPEVPLDGELWGGRKRFQRTISIVRRQDRSEHWKEVAFVVFDAPAVEGAFEDRLAFVARALGSRSLAHARVHEQQPCRGLDHLREELARVEALGGEGLMMRQPRSSYEVGRSTTLLKVKSFQDAEARVVGHLPGAGRHAGRLGALEIEMANGTRFSVGTGFSDAERAAPPPLGAVITFRYQELSEGGVPRFPTYVGVRDDVVMPVAVAATHVAVAPTHVAERMFELVDGASSKFWAISVADDTHTVRFGRTGTSGQSKSKQFPDAAAATRDAEALVSEKLRKGYREVSARVTG